MSQVLMPQLSDSMEQGLVLQWLVADGAEVEAGDELVEIETDKATMTYHAEVAGRLTIVIPEGTAVAVGDVIATVGRPASPKSGDPAPERANGIEPPSAKPPREAVAVPSETFGLRRDDGDGTPTESDPPPATPVARRLAAVHGIALASLAGSGPRGRITKGDVLRAGGTASAGRPTPTLTQRELAAPAAPGTSPALDGNDGEQDRFQELTRPQQVVARRMAEAKATIPHFQVQTEVEIGAVLALRADLKSVSATPEDAMPSLNDVVVKAVGAALRHHPRANGAYRDGRFQLYGRVNVGVAVAADEALIVPTVFDVDQKSIGQIARETRELVERVRTGQITPPELSGATLTVSNLGMFGMTAITPVINPPQAAILGVGATRETLARDAVTDEIVDRPLLTLTLSCDHRILYGADAARFLADVKALLETPLRLIVN